MQSCHDKMKEGGKEDICVLERSPRCVSAVEHVKETISAKDNKFLEEWTLKIPC